MKQVIYLTLLMTVGVASAWSQAVVTGFKLNQISFTAPHTGNIPCSEYGQISFAVRQFPGTVQYVQIVIVLPAISNSQPGWLVQNLPLTAGAASEATGVDLTMLGVMRGTCINGWPLSYDVTVTDHLISTAPAFANPLTSFAGLITNGIQGSVSSPSYVPGTLPLPYRTALGNLPTYPATSPFSGDLNAIFIDRPGVPNVGQALGQDAPAAAINGLYDLQLGGQANWNQITPELNLPAMTTAMLGSAATDSWTSVEKGMLNFSQLPNFSVRLGYQYATDTNLSGLGPSLTSGSLTALLSGASGPPPFSFLSQAMAHGQALQLGMDFLGTGTNPTPTGSHMAAVSGLMDAGELQYLRLLDSLQSTSDCGLRVNWSQTATLEGYLSLSGIELNRIHTVYAELPLPTTFLYVGQETGNSVAGYAVTTQASAPTLSPEALRPHATAAGGLTAVPGSPVTSGMEAVAATSALGKYLYVANYGANNVSAFNIDPATGTLTAVTGSPFAVTSGGGPFSLAVDPLGHFLYVADSATNDIAAFRIDPVTGALVPVAGSPFGAGSIPAGMVISPSGRLLFVANNGGGVSVYELDPTSGVPTQISGSPFTAGSAPNSVAVDPRGRYLYLVNAAFGASNGNISVFNIGPTGALTPITGSPYTRGTQPDYIVVDATGQFAYVSNYVSSNVSAFTINSSTGALTPVAGSPYTVPAGTFAVAVDSRSQFVYVTSQSGAISAFTINSTTGALTPVAGSPFTVTGGPARLTMVDVLANIGPANPIPTVTALAPSGASIGAKATLVTVYGADFVPTSVVRWNGASRVTTYLSSHVLQVALPASDLAAAIPATVTVQNPAPTGGTSSGLPFKILAGLGLPSVPGNGTLNDAGFQVGMPVAPGSIAASFGTSLAVGSTTFTSTPPNSLGGSSVMFEGHTAAPLFFASPNQINMQIPWEVGGGERTSAVFTTATGSSAPVTIPIAEFAPGVFVMNAAGQGAIVISSGEVAGAVGSIPGVTAKPTTAGDYLTIYCTGLGNVTNRPATGALALAQPLSQTPTMPAITLGGVAATNVLFSGLTPGYVGLYQINVQVPPGITPGNAVPVVVTMGGFSSPSVTIAVQ
jgi:uncharacterized protein (TIGR03437 family)